MRTIGFVISNKENEFRRSILPNDIARIRHKEQIWIESNYGAVLGIDDNAYLQAGARIGTREQVLQQDIICDAKIGEADYLPTLRHKILWGWMHAVQNRDITDNIILGKHTAYAWENMYQNGVHCFHRNNEIAGWAAVQHAFLCAGRLPQGCKAAIIGRGNTGRGATQALQGLGVEVQTYGRADEELLRSELGLYDVIVNAVLWDTCRTDHIIYRDDLKKMKHDAFIVDISCDKNGAIETSRPTTIDNPVYYVDGIMHYAVVHAPTLYWKTTSESLSEQIAMFVDQLIEGCEGETLQHACIIKEGVILDQHINLFQHRV